MAVELPECISSLSHSNENVTQDVFGELEGWNKGMLCPCRKMLTRKTYVVRKIYLNPQKTHNVGMLFKC